METDKDKSHLIKLFNFQKEKKAGGGGGRGGYFTSTKTGVTQGKGKDLRGGTDLGRKKPPHCSPGNKRWTGPDFLVAPARARNGPVFTPRETWVRLCDNSLLLLC